MGERNRQKNKWKFIGLYFLLVGVVIFCVGISGLINGFRLKSQESSQPREYVVGTVISYERSTSGGSSSTYSPVYEYFYQGERFQYTSPMGSSDSRTKYPEGSITTLVMFSGDPSTTREDGFFVELRLYFGGVLSLLGGLVFGTVGFLVAIGFQNSFREQTDFSPYQKHAEPSFLEKVRTSPDQFYLLAGGMFFSIGLVFTATGVFLGDDNLFLGSFTGLGMIAMLLGGRFLYHFFKIL